MAIESTLVSGRGCAIESMVMGPHTGQSLVMRLFNCDSTSSIFSGAAEEVPASSLVLESFAEGDALRFEFCSQCPSFQNNITQLIL